MKGGPGVALCSLWAEAAEKMPVEVFPEGAGDTVEGDRIDAGVYETEAETDPSEGIPEVIVVRLPVGVEVVPDEEHVVGEVTDGEDDNEGEH